MLQTKIQLAVHVIVNWYHFYWTFSPRATGFLFYYYCSRSSCKTVY